MKLIVFALLCTSCFCAKAQHSYLAKEDVRLAKLFEKVFGSKYLDRQEIAEKWQPMLERELLKTLTVKGSEKYKFPHLAKHVSIVHSPDSLFRLFVWDTRESGHTPRIFTVVQYTDKRGMVGASELKQQPNANDWIDESISYDSIICVDSNGSYLFRGYSHYGSIHSAASLSLFTYNGKEIIEMKNAFELSKNNKKSYDTKLYMNYTYDEPFIEMVVGETKSANYDSIYKNHKPAMCYDTVCAYINYDINTSTLTYPEMRGSNEGLEFGGMTGKMLHLHYNGQVFTRKEE